MLRVGVIGCGGIAERRHLPVLSGLNDRVVVSAISDVSEDRLALIGDQYGVPQAHRYSDYESMLEKESLDLVHICTPHHLHESQAIASMQAGTDVLLEKPIATSVEEADRIIAVSEETGRRLTVSHNQLFRPVHRAIAGCVSDGSIGDIFLIRNEGFSSRHVVGRGVDQHWRTSASAGGGGPLIDNGYHQIYCAVDHLQSPAKRVYARIGRYVQDIDVEDTALLLIEHENGATSSVQVGWCAPGGGVRVEEIYGTRGQIRLGGELQVSVWQEESGVWTLVDIEPEGHDEAGFPALLCTFIDAIVNQTEVPVQPRAARHVLGIVRAAYESGTNGQPVDIV